MDADGGEALISDGLPVADAAVRAFGGRGSLGNGAAMRVAPVAVRYADDHEALLDAAKRSARVTHAHPIGIDAAAAQAAAVGAALRGEDALAAARAAAATPELRCSLAVAGRLLAAAERPAASGRWARRASRATGTGTTSGTAGARETKKPR